MVLSADKGLAGAYSSNVIKEVLPQIARHENVSLITVGRKARDYFKRRNYAIAEEYTGFSEKPTYQHAVTIARQLPQDLQQVRTMKSIWYTPSFTPH